LYGIVAGCHLLIMKRRKLFYVPGMMSLLVVPVLFYYSFNPTPVKRQPVIKFFAPKESMARPYFKGKKINTVYLDDNHSLNVEKLDFIAQEALKLKFYHDTTQIIKVQFTEEATYGEFVQLVNSMQMNSIKRYILFNNSFYIFGEYPPESQYYLTY